jgi:hypothetical protein
LSKFSFSCCFCAHCDSRSEFSLPFYYSSTRLSTPQPFLSLNRISSVESRVDPRPFVESRLPRTRLGPMNQIYR